MCSYHSNFSYIFLNFKIPYSPYVNDKNGTKINLKRHNNYTKILYCFILYYTVLFQLFEKHSPCYEARTQNGRHFETNTGSRVGPVTLLVENNGPIQTALLQLSEQT